MKPLILLIALLLHVMPISAQPMGHEDFERWAQDERARIAAEQDALQRRWIDQERACYQRFAVNDCLRQAHRQQREAQADLRRQEIVINDEERKRKGASRLRQLEQSPVESTPPAGQ